MNFDWTMFSFNLTFKLLIRYFTFRFLITLGTTMIVITTVIAALLPSLKNKASCCVVTATETASLPELVKLLLVCGLAPALPDSIQMQVVVDLDFFQ